MEEWFATRYDFATLAGRLIGPAIPITPDRRTHGKTVIARSVPHGRAAVRSS